MNKIQKLSQLKVEYDKLQNTYGDPSLDSINFGGCINNPNICFVFMNPTKKILLQTKNGKEENLRGLN